MAQLEFHHLALIVVSLPKAHLTSHSMMSGSRWVITPSWLSRSRRSFLYSSVYSCHLFLISSTSVRSISFLSFIMPIFAWNVPLVSLIFLKRLLVFPIQWFSSISLHCSLKKAFFSLLASLWNSEFRWVYLFFSLLPFTSLLFSSICRVSSGNHLDFWCYSLHFFWSSGMHFETNPYSTGESCPYGKGGGVRGRALLWSSFKPHGKPLRSSEPYYSRYGLWAPWAHPGACRRCRISDFTSGCSLPRSPGDSEAH